jgi:hypothetical protein
VQTYSTSTLRSQKYLFLVQSVVSLPCAVNSTVSLHCAVNSISTLCSQQYLYIVQSTVSLHFAINSIPAFCNQQYLCIVQSIGPLQFVHVQIFVAKAPLLSWILKLMKDTVPTWILTRQAKSHEVYVHQSLPPPPQRDCLTRWIWLFLSFLLITSGV